MISIIKKIFFLMMFSFTLQSYAMVKTFSDDFYNSIEKEKAEEFRKKKSNIAIMNGSGHFLSGTGFLSGFGNLFMQVYYKDYSWEKSALTGGLFALGLIGIGLIKKSNSDLGNLLEEATWYYITTQNEEYEV